MCKNVQHCNCCDGTLVRKYLTKKSQLSGRCCGDPEICLTDNDELIDKLGDDHKEARLKSKPFELTAKQSRFEAYETIRKYLGYFGGKGNRVQLPTCIEAFVKDAFSERGGPGSYTGFRSGTGA